MKRQIRCRCIMLLVFCLAIGPVARTADHKEITAGNNKDIIAPEGSSYQWYLNGKKLDGLDKRRMHVMEPGIYSVEVKKADGTIKTSEAKVTVTDGKVVVIYLIGDSTMADYESYYSTYEEYFAERYPLTGWGQVFQEAMSADSLYKLAPFITEDSVIIDNHARGGRSSRSFWEEGRWTTVYNLIEPGDYVIIQFGHNDASKNHPERYVDTAGYKDYLRLYVNETREKGGIPVLATPVNRNYNWAGDRLTNIHGNYPQAMKEVANELHVPLIDVTQRSLDFFTEVGKEYVTNHYFMNLEAGVYEAYPDGESDNTHFQPEGARAVAQLVFEGIQDLRELKIETYPEEAGKTEGRGWYEEKYDSVVTIKAYPEKGFVFDGWSGDVSGSENPMEVSMTTSKNIIANFKPTDETQFYLNTSANNGGTVLTEPFGGLFIAGEKIMLQALPENGYEFYCWTGDSISFDNPITIKMDHDKEIHALFKADNETIFQVDEAVGNPQPENENRHYSGAGYLVLENVNDSVVWEIRPGESARFGISFRYTHEAEGDLYADLYLNDELIRENMVFDSVGNLSGWQHTSKEWERLKVENYRVKLIFKTGTKPLYIDYMKFSGRSLIGPATGIQDHADDQPRFNVFPNPITNYAILEFDLDRASELQIDIFTMHGQMIQQVAQGKYHPGHYELPIGPGLNSGVYAIRFDREGICSTYKIIVY